MSSLMSFLQVWYMCRADTQLMCASTLPVSISAGSSIHKNALMMCHECGPASTTALCHMRLKDSQFTLDWTCTMSPRSHSASCCFKIASAKTDRQTLLSLTISIWITLDVLASFSLCAAQGVDLQQIALRYCAMLVFSRRIPWYCACLGYQASDTKLTCGTAGAWG